MEKVFRETKKNYEAEKHDKTEWLRREGHMVIKECDTVDKLIRTGKTRGKAVPEEN